VNDTAPTGPTIYIDADACPVKDEIYRVAQRFKAPVFVVANSFIRVPADPLIKSVIVEAGPDIADDWIAERATPRDVVVTADIPLADRCLKAGAQVLHPTGKIFDQNMIGAALGQRALMEHLRSTGDITGGPKPFSAQDRSKFLSTLDAAMHKAKKR
jgi:uncharacterized protein YaiI (UPF0178 family)